MASEQPTRGFILTKEDIDSIADGLMSDIEDMGDVIKNPQSHADEIKCAEEMYKVSSKLYDIFHKLRVLTMHEEIPESEPVLKCTIEQNIKKYYDIFELEREKGESAAANKEREDDKQELK
jgi:hypothetical protein